MKTKIALLILLIATVGLNLYLHYPRVPKIDKELKPYVETFLKYCELYKVDCSETSKFKITIKEIPNMSALLELLGQKPSEYVVVGLCHPMSNEIDINLEYYLKSSNVELEQLMMHELGHCVLGKDHTEDTELAIMNPYTLLDYIYLRNYKKLINAFFNCKTNCPVVEFDNSVY